MEGIRLTVYPSLVYLNMGLNMDLNMYLTIKCKTTLVNLNMAVMKRRNNVSLSSTHLVRVGLFDCEKKN